MSINQPPLLTTGDANGIVTMDLGSSGAFYPTNVALQADGKILVNSYAVGSGVYSELVRYNADGSLDTTFGGGGIVSAGPTRSTGADLAVQADGKIVVSGSNFTSARYNNDGSLDASFGTGGTVATDFGFSGVSSLIIQPDGRIVAAGLVDSNEEDVTIARYDSNGNLDASFGTGGKVTTSFGTASHATAIVGQPDGKLVAAAFVENGAHDDFTLLRYNNDGTLDGSFGNGGKVTTDFGSFNDIAYSVTVQPDGKIIASGFASNVSGVTEQFAIARYNADGSLDATFGTGGKVLTDMGGHWLQNAESVTVEPDGKIIVAGYTFAESGGPKLFALARYNSDGSLDGSFGTGGKVVTGFGSDNGEADSVVIQPDGKILVVGTTGATADVALARYNSDGSLDTSFGNAGAPLSGPAFYTENTSPIVLNARATVHDAELAAAGSYEGASLTLARHGGANPDDVFGASGNLSALSEGGAVTLSGVAIGTVTQNSGGALVLTFGSAATEVRVDEALRAITYKDASDAPGPSARIDWSFSDGNTGAQGSGGALTAAGVTNINITAVNDPAVNTVPAGPLSTVTDTDFAITGLSVSDPDSASLSIFLDVRHGTLIVAAVEGATVVGSGTSTLLITGTVAQLNATLSAANNVLYRGAADFSGADTLRMSTADSGGSSFTSSSVALDVTAVPGSLSIGDVTISEGDSGSKVATFTVTRDGTAPIAVDFATADGSATTADNDYIATSGTLSFAAGVKIQTISVTINGDSRIEADEAFSVHLSNATNGATISRGSATGTIANDDALPAGTVSIDDVTISEGDNGSKLATFTVARTGGTAAFDVNFATIDGSATTADNDYIANAGTLHFGAGVNAQTISVTINGDSKVEPNEAFFVNLSGATNGATVSDNLGIGTIINDDTVPAGSISISDFSLTEGNSGTNTETFTVTRTGGTAAFDVSFATADGSATVADHDYAATAGTLHFGGGVNTQTISVAINGDTKLEADEAFSVNLSNATNGATIIRASGTGTIANDDAVPAGSLSIDDVTVSEGGSGSKLATFTVTRSSGTAAFDVNFATSDGSALTADNDYVAIAGTLHFAAGVNTQTISVGVNGDTKVEPDEAFFVDLSGATNGATISDSFGIGTIINDDTFSPGSISVNDVSLTEGNSGTKIETFTVTRTGGTAAFYVSFATADGSATVADHDYIAAAGTLHFGDGVNAQTISVTIDGDTKVEPNESFLLNLSGATSGAVISDSQGIGTIQADDLNPAPRDFNADATSDVFWRNDATGHVGTWEMHNNIPTWHDLGTISGVDHKVAGIGDFNGDGTADLLWRNDATGHVGTWEMHDNFPTWHDLGGSGVDHKVVGTGDFNGDGTADLFWRDDTSGHTGTWEMHNNVPTWHDLGGSGVDHKVVGVGDFNGDGTADVFWRNDSDGHVGIWEMHNNVPTWRDLGGSGVDHKAVGIGDFNGDGTADILWRNDSTGHVGIWEMHNNVPTWHDLGGSGTDFKVAGVGDFNGDGTSDIFWRNDSDGHVGIWEMHNNVPTWHDLGLISGADHSFIV